MTLNCVFQNDVPGMLAYSLKLCMSLMQNKQFRNKVLRVLVKIYMNLEKPDFINVCQVLLNHLTSWYTTAPLHVTVVCYAEFLWWLHTGVGGYTSCEDKMHSLHSFLLINGISLKNYFCYNVFIFIYILYAVWYNLWSHYSKHNWTLGIFYFF